MKTFYDWKTEETFMWLHEQLPGITWLLLHLKCRCIDEAEYTEVLDSTDMTDKQWLRKLKCNGCITVCRRGKTRAEVTLIWKNEMVRCPGVPKGWKKPSLGQFRDEYAKLHLSITDSEALREFRDPLNMQYDSMLSEFIYQLRRLADHYLGGH